MATDQIKPDEVIQPRRTPWMDNVFRPVIIIIMIMCLNIAVVQLVWQANPAWNGAFFLLGMLLTTVEAVYSHRMLRRFKWRGGSTLRFRLVEIFLLLLVLRLITLVGKPWSLISAEAQSILQEPSLIVTTEYYLIVTLAIAAWAATTFTIADLDSLYDPYVDNRTALDGLAERFFWGGGLLVLISGISQWVARSGFQSLTDLNRPTMGGVVLNVMLYFMLGLVLLSQINLTRLRVRWEVQKIDIAPGIIKRWAGYGLLFLSLLTAIAFILPTGYGIGFLQTTGYLLTYFFSIFILLFQMVIVLVTLPIVLLLSWLGYSAADPLGAMTVAPPPILSDETAATPGWLTVLRSALFWLVATAAVGYLIKTYLDDRPELVRQLLALRPIAVMVNLIKTLWRILRAGVVSGIRRLPRTINGNSKARAKEREAGTGGWFRRHKDSPRLRVIRYYLNIVQQAGQKGNRRRQSQTPFEFEPELTRSAPEVENEIQDLTGAFVQARYSKTEVDIGQVSNAQHWWQRIKQVLRRR
jgi:hypothetical protein